jgi:hypothetical protein
MVWRQLGSRLACRRTHPRTRSHDTDGMLAGWLAQTAHAYPTWPIAVQQSEGPVLRIRKSRAAPTILDDMGPFGHTREIERPAPAPRSVADSTSVTAGRPLVMCGPLRLSGFDAQAVWLCDVDTRVFDYLRLQQDTSRKTDRSLIEHQCAAGGYCPYTPRSSPCMTQRCC